MKANLGTVIHGTHRHEDLIPAFADELRRLRGSLPKGLSAAIRTFTRKQTPLMIDLGDFLIEELMQHLDDYAPPYAYFGAHEGDGSDFGFWVNLDDGFDGLKVSDLSEVPKGYRGEVLHVNDHGNMSLYTSVSRGLREVWGVV